MNTVVASIALAGLALSASLALVRVIRPGSLADKAIGLDTFVLAIVAALAVQAAWRETSVFLDIMVVAALLGFLGTVTVARFIEGRGD